MQVGEGERREGKRKGKGEAEGGTRPRTSQRGNPREGREGSGANRTENGGNYSAPAGPERDHPANPLVPKFRSFRPEKGFPPRRIM